MRKRMFSLPETYVSGQKNVKSNDEFPAYGLNDEALFVRHPVQRNRTDIKKGVPLNSNLC